MRANCFIHRIIGIRNKTVLNVYFGTNMFHSGMRIKNKTVLIYKFMNEMFLLEIGTRNKLKESYFTWDVKQRYRNEASRQHRIAIEKILEKRRPMN